MKRKYLKYSLLIIAAVILIDQFIKGALVNMLTGGVPAFAPAFELLPYPYMIAKVADFFNIVFTWNPGTSFSALRAVGVAAPLVLILLTGGIIAILLAYLIKRVKHPAEHIAFSLIIGGALGNFIDRIRFGAVIDFLDFHIGAWHWPAFNFADICICIGVGILIISWLFFNKR